MLGFVGGGIGSDGGVCACVFVGGDNMQFVLSLTPTSRRVRGGVNPP